MHYRNVSETTLVVPSVDGSRLVNPGEAIATAPKFAEKFVRMGQLEPIPTETPKGEIINGRTEPEHD